MTPKQELEAWRISGISRKYPSYRRKLFISHESWLEGKSQDDESEGLWRIRDKLYDLTDFAKRHPGGAFWIERTKGTDITEPFESHHIGESASRLLPKYEVRAAKQPRNYKFTLDENGFYMTLKRRVRDKLKALNYKPTRKTDLLHSGILAALFLFTWLDGRTDYLLFKGLAALSLCWLGTSAHNFFHQRDNWRMYTFNFTLMNYTTWRISHALSHHVYPNSLHDLEMSLFEPFLCWVPSRHYATKLQRIISVFISPVVYCLLGYVQLIERIVYSLTKSNIMFWHDVIGFSLPAFLYLTTDLSLGDALVKWLTILTSGSFLFGFIGLTAAHHDPRIYHDGDAVRPDHDWGLFQIDTIIDRGDVKWSDLLVLTHFGEHALHHLFPTLDHGVLKLLYPELQQTLKEFNGELREINHWGHIKGQTQQLLRTEVNPVPPGSKKLA
ncbi:cytochrome b5-related protein [Scaptodrosophila lebanonensis]|uniref:Cytochrome b5-related protein n=1 Tax=Drosophila lebanonensis TaxID=7225 RepID=A0A6J2U8E3_DROLE|nr:cytochrome b5-related protein [Scaptodrosophila lebanonensis]